MAGTFSIVVTFLIILFELIAWRRANYSSKKRSLADFERWSENSQILSRLQNPTIDEGQGNKLFWRGYREFKIINKFVETIDGDIISFYFQPLHGNLLLPKFKPGQYLTFKLNWRNQPKICYYSLSDANHQRYFRVSIKRARPRDGVSDFPETAFSSSCHFHDALGVGDNVMMLAPKGEFFIELDSLDPVVLIGGGIGVTPMRCMLQELVNVESERQIWFFYGVRNSLDHAFLKELNYINECNDNVHLCISYSQPLEKDKLSVNYQHTGRISIELIKKNLGEFTQVHQFYLCGPPKMMSTISQALLTWPIAQEFIHSEAFGPASITTENPDAPVSFQKSKQEILWSAEDGSLLEFSEDNGVTISSNCKAGACGTCEVRLISGEVEYPRGETNFSVRPGFCLTCACVPKGAICLDI